jgi:hypothetical protein
MKRLFYKLLLAANLFFAAGTISYASHFQGDEITYNCIAPNTYVVTCKVYMECSTPSPTAVTLQLKAGNCNAGRTVILPQTGISKIGDPYCSAIGNGCTTPGRENHMEVSFIGTITFSAAEAACPDWILSMTNNARQSTANLLNPQGNIYCEALLNLGGGSSNNSAIFNSNSPTVEYVCVSQDTRLSFNAYDPDCDSLSYEMITPLQAAGVSYAYAAISTSGQQGAYLTNPNPPVPFSNTSTPPKPQFGYFSGTPVTTYSPTYPIPSYNANWNTINPATGIPFQFVPVYPYFEFDALTAQLRFRPAIYFNSPPIQGDNKYAVVVKVKEWRKINGTMRLVGTVMRDILLVVADCGGNQNPDVYGITANGQAIQPGDVVTVRPNGTLNLQFSTTDPQGDTLALETDATTVLTGATFTHSTAFQPTGTINWIAPATNGVCGIRYFYIKAKDNACPVRGKSVSVIGVRVSNTGTATGLKEDRKNNLNFIAYPNPFTESVSFRFNAEDLTGNHAIEIYNGLGQKIDRISLEEGKQTIEWQNAPKFPAGNYIARLISAGKPAQTLKFMKIR